PDEAVGRLEDDHRLARPVGATAKEWRMANSEWVKSADPLKMLNFLGEGPKDRKRMLFVAACWRSGQKLMRCNEMEALEKLEQLADNCAGMDPDQVYDDVGDHYLDLESRLENKIWNGHEGPGDPLDAPTEASRIEWDDDTARAAVVLFASSRALRD